MSPTNGVNMMTMERAAVTVFVAVIMIIGSIGILGALAMLLASAGAWR